MTNAGAQSNDFNNLMAKEISHGVSRTLSDVFGVKPAGGAFELRPPVEASLNPNFDISGFVELNNQEKHRGALMVSFPESTNFGILGKFYRKQFTGVDKSIKDGVGELTNMIFGLMKANLSKSDFSFKMALPNVVLGNETPAQFRLMSQAQTIILTIPFETEYGPFTVTMIIYPVSNVIDMAV